MTRRGRIKPESSKLIALRNNALTPVCAQLNIWKVYAGTIIATSRIDLVLCRKQKTEGFGSAQEAEDRRIAQVSITLGGSLHGQGGHQAYLL
jgi:hypothetical protein